MNNKESREFMRAERKFERSKRKIQKYIRLAEAWGNVMQEAVDAQKRLIENGREEARDENQ